MAKVALFDINSSIFDIEAQIRSFGGTALAIKVDVSSSAEVDVATKAVVEAFGPIDGGANLAGISGSGTINLEQETDDAWDRVIGINLGGVKNAMRAQLQYRNSKGASIVNASSIGARIGSPGNAAYSASKAAVSALSKSVAREMGSQGVRVNAIAPGITDTAMVSAVPESIREGWRKANVLGRLAEPVEMANVIHFLLSDKSSFITSSVRLGRSKTDCLKTRADSLQIIDVDAGRI
ncbi:uncharacterized protein A1O9_09266 [Exophiala aquamarina CBS 119918]|uniref:3-oxoacyl-[acyl-carrier protein] reductase n=1 Tax=Exophiala aquamarina CBS 119918 TaxID=1182545 RepID=A0A072P414_9EURO|nr:uncharacterized protein A1O9_09266 [Exophiala aquamarina CBS 119918]KEF54824.1 hypothetical protein A1O9_09266 [Exophiala aquamarina CBS 119918]